MYQRQILFVMVLVQVLGCAGDGDDLRKQELDKQEALSGGESFPVAVRIESVEWEANDQVITELVIRTHWRNVSDSEVWCLTSDFENGRQVGIQAVENSFIKTRTATVFPAAFVEEAALAKIAPHSEARFAVRIPCKELPYDRIELSLGVHKVILARGSLYSISVEPNSILRLMDVQTERGPTVSAKEFLSPESLIFRWAESPPKRVRTPP